ncbi:GAF and ANTAR domain-containing protein [Arthrobacter agilis]|uniref:GAF and ANTAR domain-containing protein n=1 Tax=Arthrobacter agilis TaxID=37921 RepID=UPI002782746C|nr:GAF and ANTAR domain-containing protein [Arthrobacter agilis]MDQ0735724.1 transcriptional regulator with GAF, ATPase, and Fis domain [Arthrobacter agilis]
MDLFPPSNELGATLGRIRGLLLTQETAQHAVDLLAEVAQETTPNASGAGVSLIHESQRTSVGATDALVRTADDLQYTLSEGPCLTAWSTRMPVTIEDTAADTRFPRWSAAAAEAGVRSCFSVPLLRGHDSLGAMKVYSTLPAAFDDADRARLTNLSIAASALLGHVQTSETSTRISSELRESLRSRDLVGIAKGVLMAREGLTEAEALAALTARARSTGVPFRQLTADIVNGHGDAGTRDAFR